MSRVTAFLSVLLVAALAAGFLQNSSEADAIEIEPVVWQFDEDYPADFYSDTDIPVRRVYIKTHDITDWMSRYDGSTLAVSSVEQLRALKERYRLQGVELVAWFVPAMDSDLTADENISRQLAIARAVIDEGFALYADIEPYDGFCNVNCPYLAENFWLPLRAQRPDAELGVIYDPRPWWWAPAGINNWMSVADVALPMCYWETFVDQAPWNDPAGCVRQGYADLATIAPGIPIEYVPMLQGDSTPEKFLQAVTQAEALNLQRVSVWRRGVMPNAVWDAVTSHMPAPVPVCIRTLADGCLLKEQSSLDVHAMIAGARFRVPNMDEFNLLGYQWGSVTEVPDGFLSRVPTAPVDGTLIKEPGAGTVYSIHRGAKFAAVDQSGAGARVAPSGSLASLPSVPVDGTWLRVDDTGDDWIVAGGARFRIWSVAERLTLQAEGHLDTEAVAAPRSWLAGIPLVPADGLQLREFSSPAVWQTAGGALFGIPSPEVRDKFVALGSLSPTTTVIPDGGLSQLPNAIADGTLIKGLARPAVYRIVDGARVPIDSPAERDALIANGEVTPRIAVLTDGQVPRIPLAPADR